MHRVVVDVETGETIVIPQTAYLVGTDVCMIDDGEPVPEGAHALSANDLQAIKSSRQAQVIPIDPVEKLRAFLAANPDVAEVVNA